LNDVMTGAIGAESGMIGNAASWVAASSLPHAASTTRIERSLFRIIASQSQNMLEEPVTAEQ
jgi:hypothetical protein